MLKIDYKINDTVIKDCIIKIIGTNIKRVMNDLFVHPTVAMYPSVDCAINDIGSLKLYVDIPSFLYTSSDSITFASLYEHLKTIDQFKDATDFII